MPSKLKPSEVGAPKKKAPTKLRIVPKELTIVQPDYNLGHMRMGIYGGSGVGKTNLVIQAIHIPEMCPVLYCDCDFGTMTFASRVVDVVPIGRMDVDKRMDALLNVANYVRYYEGKYKTVIVDCMTSTYLDIIQTRVETGAGRGAKAPDFVPTMGDWMHATFRMRVVIAKFKTAPINFIATAISDEYVNDVTGAQKTRMSLSKKISEELPKDFDIVGYLSTRMRGHKVIRQLQVEPFGGITAKNRSEHKLPPVFEIFADDDTMLHRIYKRVILGKSLEEVGIVESKRGVVQLVKPASE